MPANSALRKLVKAPLARFQGTTGYRYLQVGAMAWDIRAGKWTEPELDLIRYAVEPGDTVIDIGANFGLWTHHLSCAVGPGGRVMAFEPIPFTFNCLRVMRRVLGFGNAELHRLGCGERKERVTFRAPLQDSGGIAAGLVHIGTRRDYDGRPGSEQQLRWSDTIDVEADIVALDEFLPPVRDLSLVKADIEGAELFALRGAQALIDEHMPSVVCEITPWYLEGFGLTVDDVTSFFFDRGYRLYRYDGEPEPALHEVRSTAEVVENNYVFVPPARRDRFARLLSEGDGR